jgi:polysaccharide export outer membrane protein
LILHTNADGSRTIKRANLNDAQFILQPEFNLQQNDIIYVEPNSSRARSSWSIPPALTLTMSSIGTLISIVTLVVTLTK